MDSSAVLHILSGAILMEGCCLLAVAFALTALILCIINRRLKQKNLLLQAELNDFQDHVAELHILLDEISKLGKVKYYIGSIENNMLKNNYGGTFNMPLAEGFMSQMQPADQDHYRENCHKLVNGEIDKFTESYSMLDDGVPKQHTSVGNTFTLPCSGEKKIMMIHTDISEVYDRSRELAAADSVLQAIFDNLPGHIFIKNISSDFTYVKCSPAYSRLLQMQPSELVGKTDFDLFKRDLALLIRESDIEIARTHGITDKRWFFCTPDGKEHAIRFISRWLTRADGSEWILGFGIDVTRQEHIAGKLRRRNKELRMLLSQISAEVMLLDKNLRFACASPAMRKFFSEAEALDSTGPTCSALCGCNVDDPAECAAAQALKDQKIHFCKQGCFKGKILQVKPLMSDDCTVNYLALSTVEPEEANISADEESSEEI